MATAYVTRAGIRDFMKIVRPDFQWMCRVSKGAELRSSIFKFLIHNAEVDPFILQCNSANYPVFILFPDHFNYAFSPTFVT